MLRIAAVAGKAPIGQERPNLPLEIDLVLRYGRQRTAKNKNREQMHTKAIAHHDNP